MDAYTQDTEQEKLILQAIIDLSDYNLEYPEDEAYQRMNLQSLHDDIGDDDNAGGYQFTREEFSAYCLKNHLPLDYIPMYDDKI